MVSLNVWGKVDICQSYISKYRLSVLLCDPVFVFRLSLCQMSSWEPSLGTEPPLAPSSRWSPGGGSSTNPSLWQSQCPLDRPKVILVANGVTVHRVCVCSAASQVRMWLCHSNTASADPPRLHLQSSFIIQQVLLPFVPLEIHGHSVAI